jgi:SAM-dependent methyltransferase
MRYEFVLSTLRRLLADGALAPTDSVLAVCAAGSEQQVFLEAGLKQATISNLDDRLGKPDFAPYNWSFQDARHLTFEANSFDHVFVSDGLHHCDSPHLALVEMFRVARKSVIVFESRDSALMRIANRMGLVPAYEVEAVVASGLTHGGVNNSQVPNFVYRWTEREFEKTVQSYHPFGRCQFRYFYSMNVPRERVAMSGSLAKTLVVNVALPFAKALGWLFPSQANSFCMVARKPTAAELWPWIEQRGADYRFRPDYAARFKGSRPTHEAGEYFN